MAWRSSVKQADVAMKENALRPIRQSSSPAPRPSFPRMTRPRVAGFARYEGEALPDEQDEARAAAKPE